MQQQSNHLTRVQKGIAPTAHGATDALARTCVFSGELLSVMLDPVPYSVIDTLGEGRGDLVQAQLLRIGNNPPQELPQCVAIELEQTHQPKPRVRFAQKILGAGQPPLPRCCGLL